MSWLADKRVSRTWCAPFAVGVGIVGMLLVTAPSAWAISLQEAITVTLEANPDIGQAIANREATEFELEQARGLYLPQVDLEARAGPQRRDSPTTRGAGTDDDWLTRREINLVLQQTIFDGFNRVGENRRQAARVDGASHRVWERSEAISLSVVREYIEVGVHLRVVELARQNIVFHRRVQGDIREAVDAITVADLQQAEERTHATEARLEEAIEDLNAARIRFFRLVGMPLHRYQRPPSLRSSLPPTLEEALGIARENSPAIQLVRADLDAATQQIVQARSEFLPKVALELRGRAGDDLDGLRGRDNELRAEVVVRWNIFRGGIDKANTQEQIRRTDEQRYRLHSAHREVEESVRLSWDRRIQQARRLARLEDQLASAERLLQSYEEQFKVGDRSLLDVLDTQNTLHNTRVLVETARASLMFAEYRQMASMGALLAALDIQPPAQAEAAARYRVGVPPTPEGETDKRRSPRY